MHAQGYGEWRSLQQVAFPSRSIDVHSPIDFLYLSIFSVDVDVFLAIMCSRVHTIPAPGGTLDENAWQGLLIDLKFHARRTVDDVLQEFH